MLLSVVNNSMKLVFGYFPAQATNTTYTCTMPTSFTTTNYQIIMGINTTAARSAIYFEDFGWVSKSLSSFVIRTEISTYMTGTSYLCIGF